MIPQLSNTSPDRICWIIVVMCEWCVSDVCQCHAHVTLTTASSSVPTDRGIDGGGWYVRFYFMMEPIPCFFQCLIMILVFHDVAFLPLPPAQSWFYTTFLKNCGRGESLETNVGGRQWHDPCKICLLQSVVFH